MKRPGCLQSKASSIYGTFFSETLYRRMQFFGKPLFVINAIYRRPAQWSVAL